MLKQDHATETPPSQAHYSPEEAGEILRIAAHLQDNTITAEQLRAIAREAGVSDENLERAIQQYEQSRQAEAQMRQRATARRKRRYKVFALFSAVIVALFAFVASFLVIEYASSPSSYSGLEFDHSQSTYFGRKLLTSSQHCKVYKEQVDGLNAKERIIIQWADGREHVVSAEFSLVASAFVAPSEKRVAVYDEGTGDVWLIDADTRALTWTARRGWMLLYPDTQVQVQVSYNDPLVGWSSNGKEDVLLIRLANGSIEEIPIPAK
jgi:hypothetical protein